MFPWVFHCLEDISASRQQFIKNVLAIASDANEHVSESAVVEHTAPASVTAQEPVSAPTAASIADILTHPLMSVSDQAMCLIGRDGIIRYVSNNWSERLHFTLTPNASFSSIIMPSQRLQYENRLGNAPSLSEPGEEQREMRLQLGTDEKTARWFGVRLFVVGEIEEVHGYLLLLRDVEEEVKRENELKVSQIKAELALKSRSEFLGHMSHELRTPLNAILGFAEMMERGVLGEIHNMAYRGYIGNIRESGHDLLQKINDLIAISCIEAGDMVGEESEFSAEDLVAYVMELHAHRAFSKDVIIKIGASAKNIFMHGNRTLLAKSLANIVLNAVTHSSEGSSITIQTHTNPQGQLAMVVSDSGSGIERERLSKLRQMLKSEHGFSLGSPEGRQIGLGLAIAKEYVGMHDGQIIIDSTKGEGTIVKIVLPAERVTHHALSIAPQEKQKKKVAAV